MKRAKFKYLFFGGLTGWFLGYIMALASNSWYFSSPAELALYSIIGAFFGAMLYNGVMMVEGYSNKFRYAVTGGLLGAALACMGGFIYLRSLDLTVIPFQSGLVFEWALIHCGIIIGIIGFIIGSRADRRLSHSMN